MRPWVARLRDRQARKALISMAGIMPPSLEDVIHTASRFNSSLIDLLDKFVSESASFDPTDADIAEISSRSGTPEDDIRYFLFFLTFIYAQTEKISPEDLSRTLSDFLKENGNLESEEPLKSNLIRLLTHREKQAAAVKRARLRDGFLPNLVSASSFVDLRPDFERDSSGKLTGKVNYTIPVVQLCLKTSSSREFEREIVLQLNDKGIEKLKDSVMEILEKIEYIKNQKQ